MEVGEAGLGGCLEVILVLLLLFFGAIRNACVVLLAELCIACAVSVCSDALGALQCLP